MEECSLQDLGGGWGWNTLEKCMSRGEAGGWILSQAIICEAREMG